MIQHSPSPTSHRRRRSSTYSASKRNSSQTSLATPTHISHSRRSSSHSQWTPGTPRTASVFEVGEFGGGLNDLNINGNGNLGSLADELAEEDWDESEVEQTENPHEEAGGPSLSQHEDALSPEFAPGKKAKSTESHEYDGSDYGEDDLEEVAGISRTLEDRMAAIEALARQGAGSTDTKESGTISRVIEQLHGLSSQANIETHVTRYVPPPYPYSTFY